MFRLWNAFLTGSRAYGVPHKDSDIDIVLRMSEEDALKLYEACPEALCVGQPKPKPENIPYPTRQLYVFRFGMVNLLCCTTDEGFEQWVRGTTELIQQAPVGREEAVAHLSAIRKGQPRVIPAVQQCSEDDLPF